MTMKIKTSIVILLSLILFVIPAGSYVYASDDTDSITVYFTLSNDGDFVTASDGTVLAHVPVTVSYFDLAEYGLEKYYRYDAYSFDEGGDYKPGSSVIESPTLLHMLIKELENHYVGRKLQPSEMHSDIVDITGSATHLYFKKFWGHDENFNYYVNHTYPLQKKGRGSTCDYILLSDGDEIDIGLFTDWGFYTDGAFAYFTESEVNAIEKQAIHLEMRGAETKSSSESGINTNVAPMVGESIKISSDYGNTWTVTDIKTDSSGKCDISFDTPGTYYVSAGPNFNTYQFVAPPICVVTVQKDPAEEEAEKLKQAKQTAITDLQGYKEPELYREAEQISLASIIQEGISSINAAETADAVQAAYNDAVSRIDALKTKAQYEAEEQGQGDEQDDPSAIVLAEAKVSAKEELAEYKDSKDLSLYRDEQKEELTLIVEQGIASIDAAQSVSAVSQALSDARSAIDAVKTDAELVEEERTEQEKAAKKLKEVKDNAKIELDLYMAPSEYREAEKALLIQLLAEGKAAIDKAETEEAIKALIIEYKERIYQLKTDAEYTAEEKEQEEEQRAAEEKRKAEILAAKIKSAKAAKPKVTAKALKKHKAKISWKKVTLSYKAAGETGKINVTGYKIYRATKKAGKYKLVKTIKKAGTLKYTDKKLKKGKKYYYKVRTYTKIDGKSYLGKWSKIKKITAK